MLLALPIVHVLSWIAGASVPPSAQDATCVRCHAPEAVQWSLSSHRTAFTGSEFQAAFAVEPTAFCRDCHAPSDTPAVGVGCLSCHEGPDAAVLAGPSPRSDAPAPHPVLRTPAFATTDACARCHEFAFPDGALRDGVALMQSTVTEHAQSPFGNRSCGDCHMPKVGDRRDHTFAASRDPDVLRQALRWAVRRVDAGTVEVSLWAGEVGHAFPTGDLFRRLEVSANVVGRPKTLVQRYLARHFGPARQSSGVVLRGEVRDDRVPASGEPRIVRLQVDAGLDDTVEWSVRYQRVAHPRGFDPREALLDGEVELARGQLTTVDIADTRP
ncbi:MAG: hypothetical protein ACRBN8_02240 [Nannocystales bacterium]